MGARAFLTLGCAVLAACTGDVSSQTSASGAGGTGGATTTTTTTTATVSSSVSTSSASSATATSSSTGVMTPDFDSIPWMTGANVGFGVAAKDCMNPAGDSVFIGYAGYAITLDAAEAWVRELYLDVLQARGVRYVFAVQGPSDPTYSQLEIGNSKIAAALGSDVKPATPFVLVLAHSSGSFVAHELIGQLATGLDPSGVTNDKVVYFDLDGGTSGLDTTSVNRLHRAYFASAFDHGTGTASPNRSTMMAGGSTYAAKGGYYEVDASSAGCNAGAEWCLHMTLITTKPHNPANADGIPDYSDFVGRPVSHAFIDAKAADAGI